MSPQPSGAARAPAVSFAAMRHPVFQVHFVTFLLAMMADNIEHVISYWMVYQKFHSAALGGFAILSHWLPFLFFSVPMGALGDRVDPRRLIQIGMALFMSASLGWGYFFVTDSLQVWHAMLLLVIHGCAGVFWQTSAQLLLHDMVDEPTLPSAVRLTATARYLGVLVGPAVGGVIMLKLGPAHGIFLNAAFYSPLLIWMWKAPLGPRFRPASAQAPRRAVRGLSDIVQTLRDIAHDKLIVSMTVLAGAASFFIGNSYQAQMPAFARDLGHGDPGVTYSMLLAADAAGALVAGALLESRGPLRAGPRMAIGAAALWCVALAGFALAGSYPLALALLFLAGACELSFNTMAQALVQMNAPVAIRGRVIGLFNMSALGLRAFAGITVGVVGALTGVHWSLAGAALCMLVVLGLLRLRLSPAAA